MPLVDDGTIPADAVLLRILVDPKWITKKDGPRRPGSVAFYEATGEVSYFVEVPGMLTELARLFPGMEVARVPAAVVRAVGFVIERRPGECPDNFQCDPACHVVAGPPVQMTRNEFQGKARTIAKDPNVTIVQPQLAVAPAPAPEPPAPGGNI
jgi:hypothetical protein